MWASSLRECDRRLGREPTEAVRARSPRSITPLDNVGFDPATDRDGRNRDRIRRPRCTRLARAPRQPGDGRRRARVQPPGDRADPRTHRCVARVPRVAPTRVSGGAPHRNEREDVDRAHGDGVARHGRPRGRFVHEPASGTRQRTDRVSGDTYCRRRARRLAAHRRGRRGRTRTASVVLRGADRGRVLAGSRTSRSTSPWWRSDSVARGTRPTRSRPAWP